MKKTCIEDCLILTASKLAKVPRMCSRIITWGDKKNPLASITVYRPSRFEVILGYDTNEQSVRYAIQLNTTHLPWDRPRYWFTCPDCGRRVAHLYKPKYQSLFLCRHCHDLTYRSRQVNNRWSRMLKAIDRI